MPNNSCPSLLTYTLLLLASAILSVGSILPYSVYAEEEDEDEDEDDYTSSTSLDQEVKQNQKCKIGVFGDPQNTVPGLCNQQAQNNVDSDSSLGGIGISMGP
jgi:hypothetical protein